MAWDKSKPTDTTKLRNLGTVIRPNWDAIESADATFIPEALNLADRTALGVANDPTALADTVILYSKQDGAGKPQAYAIDPDSVISKLTGGSFTAASPGKYVAPNGFTVIWGTGNADTTWTNKNLDLTGFTTSCLHVSGSANGSTKAIGFQLVSNTQYKVKCDSGTSTYFYYAIGK